MSIRIHTPTQAKSLSTAASHQLDSLIAATGQALSAADVSWSKQTIKSEKRSHSKPDTGSLFIRIESVDNKAQPRAALTIRPRFPGALISHDLEIFGSQIKCSSTQRPGPHQGHGTDPMLAEPDHYGSFAPLPLSLLKASGLTEYCDGQDRRILCVLSEANVDSSTEQQDIDALCGFLKTLETVSSVTVISGPDLLAGEDPVCNKVATAVEKVAGAVRQQINVPVHTLAHHKIDPIWWPAFMTTFDLGLFAGCSYFADAVQLGLPVHIWRIEGLSKTLIDSINNQLTAEWMTQKRSITQQQRKIIWQNRAQKECITIGNCRYQLEQHLFDFISVETQHDRAARSNQNIDAGLIVPPMAACYPGSQLKQTRHSISRAQRKLRKFGQSPTRFIRDSNSAVAKLIHPLLRDPAA